MIYEPYRTRLAVTVVSLVVSSLLGESSGWVDVDDYTMSGLDVFSWRMVVVESICIPLPGLHRSDSCPSMESVSATRRKAAGVVDLCLAPAFLTRMRFPEKCCGHEVFSFAVE